MVSNTGTFGQRLQRGRQYEEQMIARLRADGHTVVRASLQQDKTDKVDVIFNGYAASLKRRESGKDLIVEVERPIGTPGRDVVGKAEIVIQFTGDGGYTVANAATVKRIAREVARTAKAYWGATLTDGLTYTDSKGNQARVRRDAGASGYAAGELKLMVFVVADPYWSRRIQ